MTAVSSRRAGALALLCALAAVPVVVHSYRGLQRDDCANPTALIPGPGVSDPALLAERARWFEREFGAFAWREGTVRTPAAVPDLRYVTVRSYDAKRLYYRPQYRLLREASPMRSGLEWLEVDGARIPIHRALYGDAGQRGASPGLQPVVAYLLVYRGGPVADPYVAQLRAAPLLLLRGASPMTLFYVQGAAGPDQLEATRAAALEWLAGAWRSYRATCLTR
jgi:hypothetical protein